MKEDHFKSGLASMIEEFVIKLKTEDRYSKKYRTCLHSFDNYVYVHFPGVTQLEEPMLGWCVQRETETAQSCQSRIMVVRRFVDYAFSRGWCKKYTIIVPRGQNIYIPYFFSTEELELFFKTCDDMVIDDYNKRRCYYNLLNKIQLPVFFRLMYSGGFRPCELIGLRLIDIDELRSIFYIRKSKSRNERMVVLDDSVVPMLNDYLLALRTIMHNPEFLFPNTKGKQKTQNWQSQQFRRIWGKISEECARIYDFRHNHITINISSWKERGYEFDGRLVYLKKFVGHTKIQRTAEYFQYTPMLVEKLKVSSAKRFKDLCPPLSPELDD